MKININKLQKVPSNVTDKFELCVFGELDEELLT